jgi:hypothetical protein
MEVIEITVMTTLKRMNESRRIYRSLALEDCRLCCLLPQEQMQQEKHEK